jgi:hypothetical protein
VRCALTILAICAIAAPARAEGESALSLGLSWATFSAPGKKSGNGQQPPAVSPDAGGMLSLSYERAFGTDFALRGEVAGGLFYGGAQKGESNVSYAALGDVGVTYRFDVLKYVPYAFGGIGGVYSGGGPIDHGADWILAVGGGLDDLLSRDRSVGIEARLASFGGDITLFTIGVRGTLRWGYF